MALTRSTFFAAGAGLLCSVAAAQTPPASEGPAPAPVPASAASSTGPAASPAAPPADAQAQLPTVTVTGRSTAPRASVAGFGDLPLERLPLQVLSVDESLFKDSGATGLRALTQFDASVGDAYNAVGYWDTLTVRGFVIDQRYNFRRDGLPISGETAIGLENKSRVELLKGTSGLQAGTSAPGGLANYVVKRPDADLRSASLTLRGAAGALASADLSQRFGDESRFGVRLNVAAERLDPEVDDARGRRHLIALAGDWRLTPDTLVEAEFESSRRSQPSQVAFSLLGDRVPSADDIDPRLNLNKQPWVKPVVFAGQTASLRVTQQLTADWRAVLHGATQRLRTDDRTAFAFGCDAEGNYDRYCSDGSFDYYDYRSENEQRRNHALDLGLQGRARTGGFEHSLQFGVLVTRYTARLQSQAYNYAGEGSIDGDAVVPAAPTPDDGNTNRTERSTELYLRDVVQLTPTVTGFAGLRHARLARDSVQVDGSEPTRFRDGVSTPWLGATWTPVPGHMLYASWGQGIETEVVPNRPSYSNRGQALPPLKSRQRELGWKASGSWLEGGLTLFEIHRPAYEDIDTCTDDVSTDCVTTQADGEAVHRGLEANASARLDRWQLDASALWLHARREGSADPAVNGQRPTNVPARSLRLRASRELVSFPALRPWAALTAESDRTLLPEADAPRIPGWARVDIGANYEQRLASGRRLQWRVGIDNLANRRAWQESPYQFSHVYLYPMTPRTWRVGLQADL